MNIKIILLILITFSITTMAQIGNWCACNDTLKNELVMISDWRNLPKQYELIKKESTFNGEFCEYKIIRNGEVVAVGQTIKNNYPDGSWYIVNNNGLLCCWGDFNKGYKFRRWYCDNKFEIVYKKKKVVIQDKKTN